jgi:hypothetical protein
MGNPLLNPFRIQPQTRQDILRQLRSGTELKVMPGHCCSHSEALIQSELKSRHTVIKRMLCGFPTGRVRNVANGPPEKQIHTGSTARQDVISNNPKPIRGLQNTEIRRFKKLRMTFPTERTADLYPAALRDLAGVVSKSSAFRSSVGRSR